MGMRATLFFSLIFLSFVAMGSEYQNRINQVCRTPGDILIIDVFSQITPDWGRVTENEELGLLDMDGDGDGDIHHGDLIKKIFQNNNVITLTYGIPYFTGHYIHGALADIRYLIESQQMVKPKAIVMAISFSVTLEWLLQLNLNTQDSLNFANVNSQLPVIKSSILDKLDRSSKLFWVLKEIKYLIEDLGVEFIIPAGNDYSLKINVATLVGGLSVGALSADGLSYAPYSNQSSLTEVYRVGDIIAKNVEEGIDINSDGVVDFNWDILSGGESIAQQYNGSQATLSTREDVIQNPDQETIISNRMFSELLGVENEKTLNTLAELYGEALHYPSQTPFHIDNQNKLYFDPENSGDRNQVAFIPGSSFALGNICLVN